MYTCMATKTISLDIEAYECLRLARIDTRESFSKVVKRATWPAQVGTAGDLLAWRSGGGDNMVDKAVLDELDSLQESDVPSEDKWQS